MKLLKKSFINAGYSKNYNNKEQSAGNNLFGTSETICPQSIDYVAGVLDGDGNFDIRLIKNIKVLKAIRIKLSVRDISILRKIKTILKCGRININKSLATYVISTKKEMYRVIFLVNGKIRLKVKNFILACDYFSINYKIANYLLTEVEYNYFIGLFDTDGTVTFNYISNRIEVHIEFKKYIESELLNFDNIIIGTKPRVNNYKKRNQSRKKIFYSVRFSYDRISDMALVYNFFKKHGSYSQFKFFRLMKIKKFLEVRHFKNFPKGSPEHIVYSRCVFIFISYLNAKYPNYIYFKQLSL